MKRVVGVLMLVVLVGLAAHGFAEEAATAAPVVPALTGEGIEAWFFSFLERLLNLFAQFIGQILQQVFGGIGGLVSGTPTANV